MVAYTKSQQRKKGDGLEGSEIRSRLSILDLKESNLCQDHQKLNSFTPFPSFTA